jgi:hypothetical protein
VNSYIASRGFRACGEGAEFWRAWQSARRAEVSEPLTPASVIRASEQLVRHMPRNAMKILAIGCGGVVLAGMFGISLASYAESGSFAFYRQQSASGWNSQPIEPIAEIASYPISPPSPPETSPAAMMAMPRARYSPGYPGDSWPEETRARPIQVVAYEPIERDGGPDMRVIPEMGGSWTEPARRRSEVRAERDDDAYIETSAEDEDAIEEPLEEAD